MEFIYRSLYVVNLYFCLFIYSFNYGGFCFDGRLYLWNILLGFFK